MEPAAVGEACRLVQGLIADPAARLSVAVETGPDEAILVGTADAYLRLALAALEFVAGARTGRVSVGGVPVAGTAGFGAVFAPGEVAVAAGWLAESADGARIVSEYIRQMSPPAEQSPAEPGAAGDGGLRAARRT